MSTRCNSDGKCGDRLWVGVCVSKLLHHYHHHSAFARYLQIGCGVTVSVVVGWGVVSDHGVIVDVAGTVVIVCDITCEVID